jgi:hypothetical protein
MPREWAMGQIESTEPIMKMEERSAHRHTESEDETSITSTPYHFVPVGYEGIDNSQGKGRENRDRLKERREDQ